MSKSKEKKKKDPVVIILDLIIIAMIFVLIGVTYNYVFYKTEFGDTYNFTQDASMFSYLLENNDYASMIQGKYVNEYNDNNESKSYHALIDYIEASSKYKVYAQKGYDDRAAEQKEIMDTSKSEMGDLEIFTDKVDKMFK